MSGPTHYERLGVDRGADDRQIRRAYWSRAKTAHPDAGGDARQFQLLQAAYEVLIDPAARRAYDRSLPPPPTPRPTSPAAPTPDGTGGAGTFSGEVSFPAYLRDITESPWRQPYDTYDGDGVAPSSPWDADDEGEPRAPVAEVLWWWPFTSVTAPVVVGPVVLACRDDAVVALGVLDGHEAWRAGLVAPPTCPPVVVGDVVVLLTADGELHGLDVGRGVTRWQRPVGPPGAGGVVAVGDRAVVALDDGRVEAVQVDDGRTRWRVKLKRAPSVPMATAADLVVAVVAGYSVDALDGRTGRGRWHVSTTVPVELPPVTTGGVVWVPGGRGALHRLDAATGSVLGAWQAGTVIAGLAADGDQLLVTAAGPPVVAAVDLSGHVRFRHEMPFVGPEPAPDGRRLHLARPDGRCAVLDRRSGIELGAVELPFEPVGAPVVARDRLLLRERAGRLWAVRPAAS